MRTRPRLTLLQGAMALLVSALVAGCGADFDPVSELKTLRVIGLQKDAPYPTPGETVNVSLLWQDDRPEPAEGAPDLEAASVTWLPACFNPPGDVYYGCFEQLADLSRAGEISVGNRASIDVPGDLLENRRPDPGQPVFGLTYVFFALCAGRVDVDLAVAAETGALPLVCRDRAGELVDSDGFVAGYAALYSFADGFANQNPELSGTFHVRGQPEDAACFGAACVPDVGAFEPPEPPAEVNCGANENLCVPVCEKDGDADCPEIKLRPEFTSPEGLAELDDVADKYYGRSISEQMWINYYVDRGGLKSPVRLLNDAVLGFNDDYGATFYAPKEKGPITIWAVVHDNRGGVDWSSVVLHAR